MKPYQELRKYPTTKFITYIGQDGVKRQSIATITRKPFTPQIRAGVKRYLNGGKLENFLKCRLV